MSYLREVVEEASTSAYPRVLPGTLLLAILPQGLVLCTCQIMESRIKVTSDLPR